MKRLLIFIILAAPVVSSVFNATAQPAGRAWEKGPQWLEDAVIYQIYPSSYKDSDGDGMGDIPGVLSKLDYIESLGVTALWFNPLFESGWVDGGYDIKDYFNVDPRFGTNEDLFFLVNECHKKGIKVFLDLVVGHTSIDHPWFKASMESSPGDKYADYYIWSDRLPDKKAEEDLVKMLASDNVMQNTTGRWMVADVKRGKYYNKNFYACQPSLNYGYYTPNSLNPWEQSMDAPGPKQVRQELKNIISFWFDRGIDGFRVDGAHTLVKNDPERKGVTILWREIRQWMDETYPDHILMAEWGEPEYSLNAGFNLDMSLNGGRFFARRMYFDSKHQAEGGAYFYLDGCKPSRRDLYGKDWPEKKVDRETTAEQVLKFYNESFLKNLELTKDLGYIACVTGNHDHLRFNTGPRNSSDQLKVTMAWILTQQLPILYYGDEIGLRSLVELPNVDGANHNGKERAGARTPMQWDSSANAGFSTCAPDKLYLPVCPEWTPANSVSQYLKWKSEGCKRPTSKGFITVESQDKDSESLLNWTRNLISLRKSTKAFWGSSEWNPIFDGEHAYPMVYTRSDGMNTYLIVLNPTESSQSVTIKALTTEKTGFRVNPVMQSGKASYKVTSKGDVVTAGPVSASIYKIK